MVGGVAYFVAVDVMNQETKTTLLNQVDSTQELTVNFDTISKDAADREKTLDVLRQQIRDTSVGKTGYMYVIDSSGTLIVHPNREGENLAQYDFIQTIMKTKEGYIAYPWEGRVLA